MVKKRTKNNFFSKRRYSKRRYSRKNKKKGRSLGGGTYWCIILYTLPQGTNRGDNFQIDFTIKKKDGVYPPEQGITGNYIAEKDYPNGIDFSSHHKFVDSELRDVPYNEAELIYATTKKIDNTSVDAARSTTPERTESAVIFGRDRSGTPPPV